LVTVLLSGALILEDMKDASKSMADLAER
jgi:hypothetical protein